MANTQFQDLASLIAGKLNLIIGKVNTNTSGRTSLGVAIYDEAATRLSNDNSIVALIDANDAKDVSLETRVSGEEVLRANADGSLTTRIGAEEVARESADLAASKSVTAKLTSVD